MVFCFVFYLWAIADVSKAKPFPQKQEKPRKLNEDNQHRTAENVFFLLLFFYYEYFPVIKRLQQMRERAGADLIKGGGRLNYWIK